MTHKGPERVAKPIVFLLLSLPLVGMVTAGFMGELGANPVEKLTHETGEWALRLLIAALAITPLRKLTRLTWLARLRRMLGLYAFFYVSLHFLTYLWLVKADYTEPAIYSAVLAVLLLARLPWRRKKTSGSLYSAV